MTVLRVLLVSLTMMMLASEGAKSGPGDSIFVPAVELPGTGRGTLHASTKDVIGCRP